MSPGNAGMADSEIAAWMKKSVFDRRRVCLYHRIDWDRINWAGDGRFPLYGRSSLFSRVS